LCEALDAYWHCLYLRHLGIEPEEKGKEGTAGEAPDRAAPGNRGKTGEHDPYGIPAPPRSTGGGSGEDKSGPGNRGKTGESDSLESRSNYRTPEASNSKEQGPTPSNQGKTTAADKDNKKGNGAAENSKGENDDKDKDDKEKDEKEKEQKEPEPSWYSAHAQATVVTQNHQRFFRSPYVGANSLLPNESAATSMTGTLFLDARLWECGCYSGELVFNPEIAGGNGFSGTTGLAGFPNGEITRVGVPAPTPYIARLYLRQTWGLGGEQDKVEDGFNQIAGTRDVNRLTFLAGKMSATDLVDDNRYSHDPRAQFLNWALMYNGAWDYPANVRGYTYGLGLDYNEKLWAFRTGAFVEPEVANGAPLDPHFLKALGYVAELEERYFWDEKPGHLRLLAYLNHAHMGNYRQALALMPVEPEITATRAWRIKYGFGISWDQELTKELGIWGRLGWNDGGTETWAFTEIDETASLGLVLKGRRWCRPQDQVGLGVACNGLSSAHADYLAAGGLGFIIGDGRLNYGLEKILELYYNVEIVKAIHVTFDFQEIDHPAYNKDRGPVAIGSIRVHFEF
jgi:high affinity Mn2+ porin